MALLKYHESRDKIREENEDKENIEEDEKSKEEEIEEKDEKIKEIKMKDKPKTILKKKQIKQEIKEEEEGEEMEEKKPKITSKAIKPKIKNEENNIEINKIKEGKTQTKLRAIKKKYIKPSTVQSNPKPKGNITKKPKNPPLTKPKTIISKSNNINKISQGNKTGNNTLVSKNISNRPVINQQNKMNKT